MNRQVLDENMRRETYEALSCRMSFDKVGVGFGQSGWSDERIRSELHGSGKTFHTLDEGYYRPDNCHATYCLVYYDVPRGEVADYIWRFLRHPAFNTHAKRLGKVVKVTSQRIEYWEVGREGKEEVTW